MTAPRAGAIINDLFEDAAVMLQLRFNCYLGLRSKEPNGPEEQVDQAKFDSDKGYKAALLSTPKRIRELLAVGRIWPRRRKSNCGTVPGGGVPRSDDAFMSSAATTYIQRGHLLREPGLGSES
jgi:hypothetical protein